MGGREGTSCYLRGHSDVGGDLGEGHRIVEGGTRGSQRLRSFGSVRPWCTPWLMLYPYPVPSRPPSSPCCTTTTYATWLTCC